MPNKTEKLPDGQWDAHGELGEHFTGTPEQIIPTILDAQQNTKKAYQQEKAARLAAEQRLSEIEAAKQQALSANPADPNLPQLQQYLATNTTAGLGIGTPEEVKREWNEMKALRIKAQRDSVINRFNMAHPECPWDQATINLMGEKIQSYDPTKDYGDNYIPTYESINSAFFDLVQEGKVKPTMTMDEANHAANELSKSRQIPAPMIRTGNPETINPAQNPYELPMDQLRKAAIQQELNRK